MTFYLFDASNMEMLSHSDRAEMLQDRPTAMEVVVGSRMSDANPAKRLQSALIFVAFSVVALLLFLASRLI